MHAHVRPQEGYGADADARLALALFSRAADLGDPEAQGQMGVRYALGVHRLEAWDAHGIVEFGEVGGWAGGGRVGGDALGRDGSDAGRVEGG